MIPDTVEYAQWKLGVRADGSIYSMASFFQKLAKAVGGAGVALALGIAGYVANQTQSASTLESIHEMFTLLPLLLMFLLILLAWIYPLDEKTHGRIKSELALSQGRVVTPPLQ